MTDSLLFGAHVHDADYWRDHPLVAEAEAHFNDGSGYVRLTLNQSLEAVSSPSIAEFTDTEATRQNPDLYFWGETGCPVSFFELAPRVARLLVSSEGPTPDDPRDWWSVGIWLDKAP